MRSRLGQWVVPALMILLALCVTAAVASALLNQDMPAASKVVDQLSSAEKVRLEEALHLKQELGADVWPEWSQADIPVLLYNETYAFLTGYPNPPAGWEPVAGDTFAGQPYYRQAWPHPQAFAEQIGDRWVASMATKEWTQIRLARYIHDDLPGVLQPIFPYRLVTPFYISEWQIAAILHESAHAYQAEVAPARFDAALAAYEAESRYPWDDTALQDDWRAELGLLAEALQAQSDAQAADLARQFLARREQRRADRALDADLVDYERQMEWLEGLGKYVELAMWRAAGTTTGYRPVAGLAADPDFKNYVTFPQRWSEEVEQLRGQAGVRGDTRFYYTGMAQALLLTRLAPGWQARVTGPGVWLEDLLSAAVQSK